MKYSKHSMQEGRTFIETLGYIAVMIALTVGFAALVSQIFYRYEASEVQQQLFELKKVISARYSADGTYANIKWSDLCAEKIGPKNLLPKRNCTPDKESRLQGHHIFDGAVKISSESGGRLFSIQFAGLPKDICAQLGIITWHTSEGSDLDHMEVNNVTFNWPSAGGSGKTLPAQTSDVVAACNRTDYTNKIKWYFN